MIDWRFLGGLAALSAVAAMGAWRWVDRFDGGQAALLAGLCFSFVSLAAGFHWIRSSRRREGNSFVVAVIGGFAARVLGLLAFAFVLAVATTVNLTVALLTVVATHFVFGAAEIIYMNRTGALE